ncbi:MotA/TolQ/ExbB proton channel family protein [Schleiferiaceae bacterium]|jgi:hypothetical protein|nr:MotA/TolQ/ExbB proton channel family protein [Schleiferiaceae bacterium]
MMNLFYQGGPLFMSILSFLLLGVLWTAWKGGPLKELGLLALAIGILGQLIGIYDAFSVFETTEISSALLAGGLKVSLTTTLYGLLIYILSLVLRAAQTWRKA